MKRLRQDIEYREKRHTMRVLLAAAVVWLGIAPSLAWATGWHDFELELDDGYAIVRANVFDVMLTHDKAILISHHDFPQIGPITQYAQQGHTLFVRAAGWRARHLFEGDTFKEMDLTQHFYFVVTGEPPSIEGPLNDTAFNAHQLVVASAPIRWLRPKNPQFWRPLLGTLAFVALAIPMLYVKYALVTVPVTLLLIGLLIMRRKARKRSAL